MTAYSLGSFKDNAYLYIEIPIKGGVKRLWIVKNFGLQYQPLSGMDLIRKDYIN